MSATTQVVGTATLTVNLATSGVTYTEPTTVTVSQSGTVIDTQTTSNRSGNIHHSDRNISGVRDNAGDTPHRQHPFSSSKAQPSQSTL